MTTIVLAFNCRWYDLGHGDSRVYIYKQRAQQYTEDHSLVNELIRAGEITLEESYLHPHNAVLPNPLG